jgi:hypothetical protein
MISKGLPVKRLPWIYDGYPEHWVIRDDSPIGESKYAIIVKSKIRNSNGYLQQIKEVDAGFNSKDISLQKDIDDYFRTKNLDEFRELDGLNEKEIDLPIL